MEPKDLLHRYLVCATGRALDDDPTEEGKEIEVKAPKAGTIVLARCEDSAILLAKALNETIRKWRGEFQITHLPDMRDVTMQDIAVYGIGLSVFRTRRGVIQHHVLYDANYNVVFYSKDGKRVEKMYKRANEKVFLRDPDTHTPTLRYVPAWDETTIKVVDRVTNTDVHTEQNSGGDHTPEVILQRPTLIDELTKFKQKAKHIIA